MTDAEQPAFAAALTQVAIALPATANLTTERLTIYWEALRDLPWPAVAHACRTAIATIEDFFPTAGKLRTLAGAGLPDAGLVHALLVDHLRQPGGDRTSPADPFLRALVTRLGGIRATVEMPSGVRGGLIGKILPPLVTACQADGIPLPTQLPSTTSRRLLAREAVPPDATVPEIAPEMALPGPHGPGLGLGAVSGLVRRV